MKDVMEGVDAKSGIDVHSSHDMSVAFVAHGAPYTVVSPSEDGPAFTTYEKTTVVEVRMLSREAADAALSAQADAEEGKITSRELDRILGKVFFDPTCVTPARQMAYACEDAALSAGRAAAIEADDIDRGIPQPLGQEGESR